MYLEASYYNIRTDSWEPILEPVVDPRNETRYVSWGVKARVVRQPPSHARPHTEGRDTIIYIAIHYCMGCGDN